MTGVARAVPRTDPLPPVPAAPAADPAPAVPSPLIRAFPTAPPPPPAPARTASGDPARADGAPAAADPADPADGAAPAREGDGDAGRRGARTPGRREQRYQETRARIVDAAAELFAERGFDAVSVVEVAKRAGVVEKTVFNHFPMKEGLVFDADPPMREALLDAVRSRPSGESVSAAAGSFVVAAVGLLGAPEAAEGVARMARVIRGSRTLQVREREILGELTDALAGLIAEETRAWPGQVEPWLAAHAVLGLYASLLELARDRVLAGVSGPELSGELRRQGRRGLALLQFGLAGYAKRR
ncbi:TetR/AcrR family transcriptional regulator [Blastococcus sp. TF02-09]|uniref:TetR/AcrR family transcriptional regulator n=1 Tax=Blastococcus sp. TF02-09 TaxID=2250576 RepID=UPI001F2105D6|nr:TetR/AcrR family transcriptional regulator [Blastococcus sp. TF02-9]